MFHGFIGIYKPGDAYAKDFRGFIVSETPVVRIFVHKAARASSVE